jgi:mRNA-degrading endonuclease RelE of RelBE toxin-antitoxin system
MYTIIFSKSAQKDFEGLTQQMQVRVIGVLERISIRPHSFISRLVGSTAYRSRAGKYRIILDINENEKRIEVLRIGDRDSIYERGQW